MIADLINIGIEFMQTCELPVLDFGYISLWELFCGSIVVGIFFWLLGCIIGIEV